MCKGTPDRGGKCNICRVVGAALLLLALALCAAARLGWLGAPGDAISDWGPIPALGFAVLAISFRAARIVTRRAALAALLLSGSTSIWLAQSPAQTVAMLREPGDVRIVEFNSWLDNRDPDAAARWIIAQRPDIVVLLEGEERSAPLVSALRIVLPFVTSCNRNGHCSTLILSRWAPIDQRALARGDADNRRALSAAYARYAEARGFAVVAVHLSHAWPIGPQHREVGSFMTALAGLPRDRLVVAGDFNASPWSVAIRRIAAAFDLSLVDGGQASWPAPPSGLPLPPFLRIDHVLLGHGWQAARSQRGPALGSDHFPFLIDLRAGH